MRKAKYILSVICLGMALFIYACSGTKEVAVSETSSVKVTAEDSIEYDVETFNTRFDSWYERQNTTATYRPLSYYELWNRQYVSAWNAKCAANPPNWTFEPVVGYDPNEDYGFEMNHKLFYYFMYVENVLKIKIIPQGPELVYH
ncbi:MAG TPA: DUF6146 family protein [Draconibacterium sp.]|nr:DUF6146 family protein [Draconibacterium sp.]